MLNWLSNLPKDQFEDILIATVIALFIICATIVQVFAKRK